MGEGTHEQEHYTEEAPGTQRQRTLQRLNRQQKWEINTSQTALILENGNELLMLEEG